MKVIDSYSVQSEGVHADIVITDRPEEFVNTYELKHTRIKAATNAVLDYLKERIIEAVSVKISEILDPRETEKVRSKIIEKAHEIVRTELSGLNEAEENVLVGRLVQEMMGLGELELILADENLEEVVVNSAKEPVWAYHKKHGWLKTNLVIATEEQIHNYASIIGRRVGRQITNLDPLMDANLLSGSRVNATLYPISAKGNSLTIRKFRKDPWTIVNFIDPGLNTLSIGAAALFWTAMQYELNVLVAGGTASGKTSFLNSILIFTPPNQRVISIEDTRELVLPDFTHWTPMVTRPPNPEGKGEVSMLDLMVNSLRMRPDRIVLGEIRRQREAEVLFEAMHTGHSVYSTLHADEAAQVRTRLTTPPIDLPESVISALHLIVVQYRQRRIGARRTFEIAEILPNQNKVDLNIVHRWNARNDTLEKVGEYIRTTNELTMHTGLTNKEINEDLKEKETILSAMLKQKIYNVNAVGRVIAAYYRRPQEIAEIAKANKGFGEIISAEAE
ncbi:MAG: ATPase, T2SS/T4P/T4SS family [Candidatus Micrarchaeia archaeon]|jgi:flagellar protein FlaI